MVRKRIAAAFRILPMAEFGVSYKKAMVSCENVGGKIEDHFRDVTKMVGIYKEHAKYLYDGLQNDARQVFLLYGDNSDKENTEIQKN